VGNVNSSVPEIWLFEGKKEWDLLPLTLHYDGLWLLSMTAANDHRNERGSRELPQVETFDYKSPRTKVRFQQRIRFPAFQRSSHSELFLSSVCQDQLLVDHMLSFRAISSFLAVALAFAIAARAAPIPEADGSIIEVVCIHFSLP
jgi:hypothetical protein